MKITLHPARKDTKLVVSKFGETLTINGELFDFKVVPNGATLPYGSVNSDWIAGDVTRDLEGNLLVPLVLPHGCKAAEDARFPKPIEDVPDGSVALPAYEVTQ